MSFRLFAGTIAAGASMRLGYRRSGGADFGAQYAMADPLQNGNTLQVNDQAKRREMNGSTVYLVTVRNIGGTPAVFDLIGGGLT